MNRIDHVAEGTARLVSQFKGLPRLRGWLRAHLEMEQEIEDAALDVLAKRFLDTADRTRLRVLGALVGQGEVGSTLEAFRTFVKGRIATNRSRGSGSAGPLSVARILDPLARAWRLYPATIGIELQGTWEGPADLLAAGELIRAATGAGIAPVVVAVPGAASEPPVSWFSYAPLGAAWDAESPGTGFGYSTEPTAGAPIGITV